MNAKVNLRALEKNDLEFLHKLNNNAEIMLYWFEEPYQSMDHLEKTYEENIKNSRIREFILKREAERLGYVGLFSIDPIHRKAEFGIMIDPKYQGYGFASTATNSAMKYAFLNLNLRKLYLIVAEMNQKAIHVYKKAGFQEEAVLKEEYFVNGSYHNAMYMSAFQRDYLKSKE